MVNDQLDAQFFPTCLFQFSTCFEQPRAHHQENQLYQYNIWYMSLCVGDRFVCRLPTQSDTCQMLYWYNWFSWWRARGCSKHVENINKHVGKNCASSRSFTKNHNEMHGQQNIKDWKKLSIFHVKAMSCPSSVESEVSVYKEWYQVIKGEHLVKNTTDIRIDVIFYD